MNKLIFSYVAGLMDGEGSIVIGVSKNRKGSKSPSHWLQVGIINTDKNLINWLNNTFGGHISDNSHSPSRKKQRPCWAWRIMSNEAQVFLEKIYPYVHIKKTQIKLAIKFQKEKTNLRFLSPAQKVKELAKRDWYKQEISKLTLGQHSL